MIDEIFEQRIVGVSFYQEALEGCCAGQPVRIVHEPDNPFDHMALRVETVDGLPIGYIPKTSGLRIAIHEQGRGVSATIASVGYGRSCQLGATLSIALSDDAPVIKSYYPDLPPPEPPKGGFRYYISSPEPAAQPSKEQRGPVLPIQSRRRQYQRRSASAG
jgi:hypothetical protein